jgi:hypothetical protein
VPCMGRIERPAEKPDPRTPPIAMGRNRIVQGRTCPAPVTMYR